MRRVALSFLSTSILAGLVWGTPAQAEQADEGSAEAKPAKADIIVTGLREEEGQNQT